MGKDHNIRLKKETIGMLNEVTRIRAKDATKTREIFAKLMESARGIWTHNESILFLAEFYLKNKK